MSANKRTMNDYRYLCSTKAGRTDVARHILAVAKTNGAVVIETWEDERHRETYIRLGFGSYRLSIHLEGSGSPGAFKGHWHTDCSGARYPKTFGITIGGSMNTLHYGSATTCEETLIGFLASLERGFNALSAEMTET